MKKIKFILVSIFLSSFTILLASGFNTATENRKNKSLIEKLNPSFNLLPIKFSNEEKMKIIENPNSIIDILKSNYNIDENSKDWGYIHRCWTKFKNCKEYLDRYERGSDKWIDIMDKCYLKATLCLSKCKDLNGNIRGGVAQ